MPRRRMPDIKDPSRVSEILRRKGIDPFEYMANLLQEKIPIYDGADAKLIIPMMNRYDLAKDEKGNNCLQLRVMDRFEIAREMSQYVYPKLRSSEIREEKDVNINVTIKQFGTPTETSNTKYLRPIDVKEIADGDM